MMWLLLACSSSAPSGPWTEGAALQSTAALDGQDALSADGYAKRSYTALPLSQVDTDRSSTLSPAELAVLIRQQDPLSFDQTRPMGALDRQKWATPFSQPALQRATWELLAFLRAEVAAVAPQATLPTDDDLRTAAATENLHSDAVQSLLQQLAALHEANHLTFPSGLLDEPSGLLDE